jgi:hypothetical protein
MTRTELLQEYSIADRTQMQVRPIQERESLWLVGINGLGDPIKAISPKQAAELAGRLKSIGEVELANQVSKAAQKAQDSNAALAAR